MAFDLRRALLKKAEHESARLLDFEFRQRARTFRLLAARLGLDPEKLVAMIAREGDEAILRSLAQGGSARVQQNYEECRREARAQLIEERGDPSPHRLL